MMFTFVKCQWIRLSIFRVTYCDVYMFTFVKCQWIRQSIFRVTYCDVYVCEVSMDKTEYI